MFAITQEVLQAYASLFVHCWDSYAVQQADGSYRHVLGPLTGERLVAHLLGRYTLGTYLLDRQSTCAFAVFDADSDNGLDVLLSLARLLREQGIVTLLEASRRGGHLWLHLRDPTPASLVRAWLLPYAQAYNVEFYPKQDGLALDGVGALLRLPLGIHRKSGGWYPFLTENEMGELVPVGETVADCCLWATQHVERVRVPVDSLPLAHATANEGRILPIFRESRAREYDLTIREWCRAQDIEAVIGRYVQLDRRGVGRCPFKEHHYRGDLRPSFQVFGGVDAHWYCYTWGRAGNLFDFLCLYHGCSAQEMWQRILCGGW
jgi:hypothetical protein